MRIRQWLAAAAVAATCTLGAVAATNVTSASSEKSPLKLLPWPKSVQLAGGELALKPGGRIVADDPALAPLAAVLRAELLAVTGLDFKVAPGPARPGDVVLTINKNLQAGQDILMVKARQVVRTREGAYRLTVKDRVSIEGFDYRAVAEGTATLLQAFAVKGAAVSLPAMTVDDWPHADYTGAMVDVARQDNTIQDLQLMVEVCRAYKTRYLQLHLTDDQAWTFPSKAYPKLGTLNGSAHGGPRCEVYKLDELKGLVQYARDRGVTLLGELEMPGHSGNARGTMPEIFGYVDPATGKAVDQGMMNLANPKLYEALDTIIGEMCEVFAGSPYFHIGYDEVSGDVTGTPQAREFMKAHNLANASELHQYFVVQVDEMLKKRGKKAILWEGPCSGASKDIVVMTWCANSPAASQLTAAGFTTITVPWNFAGVKPADWTMYHSNGCVLKPGDSVLGASLPAWEQKGEVHVRWLRGLPGRAERTWGPDNTFTDAGFARRLEHTDRVLDRMLYGFAIRHDAAVAAELFQTRVTLPTSLALEAHAAAGKVHYTTDGSEPTALSPAYTGPVRIADNLVLKARLFDAAGAPAAAVWSQPYSFEPLTLTGRGLVNDSAGKPSRWFAGSMTVSVTGTMKTGTIRCTLDGSDPQPGSKAYAAPVELSETTTIKARWFDEANVGRGAVAAATYQKLETAQHAALGKPVKMLAPADLENRDTQAKLLTDGFLSRQADWTAPEVLRLGPKDLDVVIDLGAQTAVKTVSVRFIHMQEAGIFPAVRVEASVSADGVAFKPLGPAATFDVPVNPDSRGSAIKVLSVTGAATGRYVKVFCKNLGLDPAWHAVPNVPCHMMLDEILVNPAGATK
ncbi:MAG: family 20 glycosylhydrolase [Planctomycetota bacterium]|nr:family 20 glycosylhydrolase [Planctomycetota bacterium]